MFEGLFESWMLCSTDIKEEGRLSVIAIGFESIARITGVVLVRLI